MNPETSYICPICEQAGFTGPGLRDHKCKKKPGRHGMPLTKTEYRIARAIAKRRSR